MGGIPRVSPNGAYVLRLGDHLRDLRRRRRPRRVNASTVLGKERPWGEGA
jgi:hypothetical protein